MDKIKWIEKLYYVIGKQTPLFVQSHDKNGEFVTKWRHYLWLTQNTEREQPKQQYKHDKFIEKFNHRTILWNEIILDFDGPMGKILYDIAWKKLLNQNKIKWAAYSGTNHIHLYNNKMFYMTKRQREDYRLEVIKQNMADEQKCIDRCMIAMEYAPHWKRGTIKDYVIGNLMAISTK